VIHVVSRDMDSLLIILEVIVILFQFEGGFHVHIPSKMFGWCLILIKGHECDIFICSYFLNLIWIIIQFHFKMFFFFVVVICCKILFEFYVRDGNMLIMLVCWSCKCNFLSYLDVTFCHIQIS